MTLDAKDDRAEVTPEPIVSSSATFPQSGSVIPTISPVGAYRNAEHEYWMNGIGPVPSVTTALGIIEKPALNYWRAKGTARAILETDGYLPEEWSEDDRIRWALQAIDAYRDEAAELGSSVHLLADIEGMPLGARESDSKTFEVGEREKPYLEAYRRFLERYSASSIVSSEHAVWSANGYAGTYDLIMRIAGELWLIDIKTSKGIYEETALQLAGYRWADSIILPGDPRSYPMPEIQHAGVLHLRPDKYPEEGWTSTSIRSAMRKTIWHSSEL